MAGGAFVPAAGAPVRQFDGRLTGYVMLACFVAASGGLLFGYDIGITGGVTSMDDFLAKFFPNVLRKMQRAHQNAWCKFDDQLLQLFTSSLFIAGMIGTYGASIITSRFGRVKSMLIGGLFFLLGAGLTGGAADLPMLVIGRVMLGFGVGFANQTVPLYLSEMAPAQLRGGLNMMFQMATTIGILCAQLINYGTERITPWGWRLSLALAGVPAAILTFGGLVLPETPNSLIERGLLEKGRAMLVKIRGTDNVQAEYDNIVFASNRAAEVRNPFSNILKRAYRPELTWAILIPAFQQLTGINAIMFYAAPLFKTIGFGASAALYTAVIIGGVNVVSTLVGIYVVDRRGRKVLFLEGGIQMTIMQVVIAVVLAIKFGNGDKTLSKAWAWIVVALICIYVAGFAWSWGPLGWLVPSEIQPLETRSAGQAITVSVNFLFTFAIGQAFLSMLCNFQFGIFLFFAGWVVIMTIIVYFFLPETKGVPIEDMADVWRAHWFWRRVVPATPLNALEKPDLEMDAKRAYSQPTLPAVEPQTSPQNSPYRR
eukprot:SM000010S04294  [mRNA]  locus=s10:697628:700296:- [translate_table: standard]